MARWGKGLALLCRTEKTKIQRQYRMSRKNKWDSSMTDCQRKTPEGDWNEGHICTHETPLPQQITSNAAGRNAYYCRFHFTCDGHADWQTWWSQCKKLWKVIQPIPEIGVQQNSAATEALPPQGTKRNKKRRLNVENVNPEESIVLHPTPWSLSKEQIKTADARAASITYSIAHNISPGPHFSKPWTLRTMNAKL